MSTNEEKDRTDRLSRSKKLVADRGGREMLSVHFLPGNGYAVTAAFAQGMTVADYFLDGSEIIAGVTKAFVKAIHASLQDGGHSVSQEAIESDLLHMACDAMDRHVPAAGSFVRIDRANAPEGS